MLPFSFVLFWILLIHLLFIYLFIYLFTYLISRHHIEPSEIFEILYTLTNLLVGHLTHYISCLFRQSNILKSCIHWEVTFDLSLSLSIYLSMLCVIMTGIWKFILPEKQLLFNIIPFLVSVFNPNLLHNSHKLNLKMKFSDENQDKYVSGNEFSDPPTDPSIYLSI